MAQRSIADRSHVASIHARPVAAGGWRRAALGLVVGACAGALLAGALPHEDRRSSPGPGG